MMQLIAIGNRTASRQTEQFVADLIKKHQLPVQFIIVNEAGASVSQHQKLLEMNFLIFE